MEKITRPSEAALRIFSGDEIIKNNIENLILDFNSISSGAQIDNQMRYDMHFSVFILGTLNALNPISNFNKNYKIKINAN